MNVLVLGGKTFFGKRIVEKLLEKGNKVTVFSRGNTIADFEGEVEFIYGDRTDYEGFDRLLHKHEYDVVIDNIAYTSSDVESCLRTFKGNIGHYIVCSSAVVYPEHQRYGLLYEEDAELSLVNNGGYTGGKRALEKLLWSIPETKTPFPFTIMRPTVVEGPNDPTWRTWYWVQRVIDEQYILVPQTNPSTLLRYVFSDDVAEAFLLVCANKKAYYRAYNVGGEEILTLEDYIKILCNILGMEADKLVSAPLKKIIECESLSDYSAAFAGTRFVLDISRLRNEFGYRPSNIESWLKTTVEWLLKEKGKKDSSGYGKRSYEVAAARKLKNEN